MNLDLSYYAYTDIGRRRKMRAFLEAFDDDEKDLKIEEKIRQVLENKEKIKNISRKNKKRKDTNNHSK